MVLFDAIIVWLNSRDIYINLLNNSIHIQDHVIEYKEISRRANMTDLG